jgi:hypothetical protein
MLSPNARIRVMPSVGGGGGGVVGPGSTGGGTIGLGAIGGVLLPHAATSNVSKIPAQRELRLIGRFNL